MDYLILEKLYESGKYFDVIKYVGDTKDSNYEIIKAYSLVEVKEYHKSLKIANRHIKSKGEIKYKAILLKSYILFKQNKISESMELNIIVEKGIFNKTIENKRMIAFNMMLMGTLHTNKEISIKYLDKSQKLFQEISSKWGMANVLMIRGRMSYSSEEAVKYLYRSLKLFQEIDNKKFEATVYLRLGVHYLIIEKNFNKSLKYHKISYKKFTKIKDDAGIASVLNNLGVIYRDIGLFDKAIEYQERSLEIKNQNQNQSKLIYSYNNLGVLYHMLGDNEKALHFLKLSQEIAELLGVKKEIGGIPNYIGKVYQDMGELNKAKEYFLKSIRIYENCGEEKELVDVYLLMIKLQIQINGDERNTYFNKMKEISERNENLDLQTKIAEVVILLSENKSKSVIKAQDILEKLIILKNLSFDDLREITLLLCEILIIDYKNFEDKESLNMAKLYLNSLNEKAIEQSIFPLYIEVIILKSRIEIVEGNFDNANLLLENAKSFVENKGIYGFLIKIEKEQEFMMKNLAKWKNMLRKNYSFSERMNQMEIYDYLLKARAFAQSLKQNNL